METEVMKESIKMESKKRKNEGGIMRKVRVKKKKEEELMKEQVEDGGVLK